MTASTLPVLDLTLGHQPREVRTCLLVWANATAKGLDVTMVGRIGAAKKICFQPTDDPDTVSPAMRKPSLTTSA